jgi:hypothetical protein
MTHMLATSISLGFLCLGGCASTAEERDVQGAEQDLVSFESLALAPAVPGLVVGEIAGDDRELRVPPIPESVPAVHVDDAYMPLRLVGFGVPAVNTTLVEEKALLKRLVSGAAELHVADIRTAFPTLSAKEQNLLMQGYASLFVNVQYPHIQEDRTCTSSMGASLELRITMNRALESDQRTEQVPWLPGWVGHKTTGGGDVHTVVSVDHFRYRLSAPPGNVLLDLDAHTALEVPTSGVLEMEQGAATVPCGQGSNARCTSTKGFGVSRHFAIVRKTNGQYTRIAECRAKTPSTISRDVGTNAIHFRAKANPDETGVYPWEIVPN